MEQNNTITPNNVTVLGIFRGFSLAILTCLIIVCNVLLFIVLPRVHTLYDQTKVFMRSLAIADICSGVFLASPKIISLSFGFWPYGNISCIAYSFMKTTLVYAEQFSFIGITVDRFIAVTNPLRYHIIMTVKRCRGIVIVFWMTAAVLLVYSTINRYINDSFDTYYSTEEGACIMTFGKETVKAERYIIGIFLLTIGPVLIVVGMSLRILQITCIHVRRIRRVQQVPTLTNATDSPGRATQTRTQVDLVIRPNHQSSLTNSGQDILAHGQDNSLVSPNHNYQSSFTNFGQDILAPGQVNPLVSPNHNCQSSFTNSGQDILAQGQVNPLVNPNFSHHSRSIDLGQDIRVRSQSDPVTNTPASPRFNLDLHPTNPQVNLDLNHQSRREMKVTFTILTTTGLYVIAWIPLMFNSIANYFKDDEYTSVFIWLLQDTLFFSNCFWNTIIYSFRLSAFRKEIKKILRCR